MATSLYTCRRGCSWKSYSAAVTQWSFSDCTHTWCSCRLLVEEQSLMQVHAGQESLLAQLTDASSYGSS